jgi:hypothetical protein
MVEGIDDFHVLASLFKHHNVPEVFKLSEFGGLGRVIETLPVQLKATGIERVGIVVDADLDVESRWNSIRNVLIGAGFQNVPSAPNEEGTILRQTELPSVGIWLMPNNRVPGLVEDFAACLIPDGDALSLRALQVIDNIPPAERRFSEAHKSKAHIHTWLAWQSDPGTPMGLAITKRYLDASAPTAIRFLDWITRLLVS